MLSLKSRRYILLIFTVFLSFSLTCEANTWDDPFWNDGLKNASLIATGQVTRVSDGHLWLTMEKVYKGKPSSGQEVEILLTGSGDEHAVPRFEINMHLLVVLKNDKTLGKYVAFTPSFGIYPIHDAIVWLPLQNPVRFCEVSLQLSDQLIRLAIHQSPVVADSLRKTALTTLAGQDPFSKKENELKQQNLMLQLFARTSKKEDIPFIIPFLKSPYWMIRSSAVQALGHIASPQVIPYLADLINSESSDNVLSLAGEALWHSGGASALWLEQRISEVSSEDVTLANDIMNPVRNTLPAPRYSLITAIMRAEGDKAPYKSLLSRAPGWLTKTTRIYISPLEHAETFYGFEEARTKPVDAVLILNFNSDTFSVFPKEIFRYRKLRKLDLGNCQIKSLPDSIDLLSELESLQIEGDELAALTPGLFRLKNLRKLYLSDMNLDSLPAAIGQLSKLEVFSYQGKKIHTLPESIGQLTQLRELHLRMAGIDSLPAGVAFLPSLKEIELYGNNLIHIPEPLVHNAAITRIDLGSNSISSIPADLSSMKNLRYLDISYNPLPLKERARIDSSYKGIVINTETYKNRAYSMEDALEHSELAACVQISNTDLGSRTDLDFSNLKNTDYLVLDNTKLKKFPESICKLTTLKSLRLENDSITTIPDCIADMKGLKALYLIGNDIKDLPPAIAQMEQLEELYLYQNKLTDLPDWIGKLKNLKELNVADNLISSENKSKIKSWFTDRNVLLFID
jgi:Leucine-rich repeat (LRR) protein